MGRKRHLQSEGTSVAHAILAVGLLLAAAAVFQMCAPLPVRAAAGGDGSLRGTVVNGTTGQVVADWPVEVWTWQEPGPVLVATGVSDAQGAFEFSGLDEGPERLYRVQATYRDVVYASEALELLPDQRSSTVQLLVYETTDRADSVVVSRFHFVVLAREPGTVSVLELYQFGNEGSETYVGAAAADGNWRSVSVGLPQDAFGLVLQNDSLAEMVVLKDNRLETAAPVLPGQATLDLAFSYRLPYNGDEMEISWQPEYPIAQVNGLVLDQGIELTSETITYTGDMTVDGQRFKQFEGGMAQPGDTLALRLRNLPVGQEGAQPPDSAEQNAPRTTSTGPTLWLILGVGLVLFGVGLTYPRWSSRFSIQHDGEVGGAVERERLLRLLAQLDDARAAGLLDEEVYRRLREEHKARLAAIWSSLAEKARAANDRGS